MDATFVKERVPHWDFEGIKASDGRYGIHEYPAMLHYMLVRELLKEYGKDKNVFFDPFCGSGVALCESLRAGKKTIGVDINPLSLLISKVRCSNIRKEIPVKDIMQKAKSAPADVPHIENADYWFKPQVIEGLGKIRSAIKQYIDAEFYELLLVAFSQTVRSTSNNRKGEFKRYRIEESKLKDYNPDVFKTFEYYLLDYIQRLKEDYIPEGLLELHRKDMRKGISLEESIDIIITSPPYGDSKTTVAYEQFSSFSLEWLNGLNPFGDANMNTLKRMSLGSSKAINLDLSFSQSLSHTVYKISQVSERRAKDVASFFVDLYSVCKHTVSLLKEGAIVCFVVGNRIVAGIEVPMDEIVKEIYENLGLFHKGTFIRRILNKRMPLLNSPTNKTGQKSKTMHYEYIVVMQKP